MGTGPERAGLDAFRRLPPEIPHAVRKVGVATVEGAGQARAEGAKGLARRIDRHRGIGLQHDLEARDMVAVSMRQDDQVDVAQVDVKAAHIPGEDGRVIPGIEEDVLAVILDQRREAPVARQAGLSAEGVVDDRNRGGSRWTGAD